MPDITPTKTAFQPSTAYLLVDDALEQISSGLQVLEEQQETLASLMSSNLVDFSARLSAQRDTLDKLLAPLIASVMTQGVQHGVVRGRAYQAEITRTVSQVLDLPRMKEYLGKNLPRFLVDQKETHVSFSIKG